MADWRSARGEFLTGFEAPLRLVRCRPPSRPRCASAITGGDSTAAGDPLRRCTGAAGVVKRPQFHFGV
jgi:hypothetical protein